MSLDQQETFNELVNENRELRARERTLREKLEGLATELDETYTPLRIYYTVETFGQFVAKRIRALLAQQREGK